MGGFPRTSSQSVKNLPATQETWVQFLSGRFPGEGNGNPLQYSCLENPMDRGAQRAIVHGVPRVGHDLATKPPPGCYWASQVALVVKNPPANAGDIRCGFNPGSGRSPGGGSGNPTQCSWTEGPGGLLSTRSQRVGHD